MLLFLCFIVYLLLAYVHMYLMDIEAPEQNSSLPSLPAPFLVADRVVWGNVRGTSMWT